MSRRRKVTYSMFAVAGILVLATLALGYRGRVAVAIPPPSPASVFPPVAPPAIAAPVPVAQAERPRIDVVFALDTTGSMSGLIEGAKRKIWSIADYIASGQPKPDLRVGLVGYRDVGDEYVTRFFDLSSDLDEVFQHLRSFRADGGGDTPEHVARALHDAVERSTWSQGDKVVKIVYLVGDAPPHTDYQDGYDYRSLARKAARKGIHLNTVRCGSDSDTAVAWREIARLGTGDFSTIEQGGGMREVATPYDAKLAGLNARLASTALGWGMRRGEVAAKTAAAVAAPIAVAADRAAFAAKNSFAVSGEGDLLNDVAAGKAKLGSISSKDLPAPMQAMAPKAQAEFIKEKQAERQKIVEEINSAASARSEFLKAEAKKGKKAAGFDDEVRSSIKRQAADVAAY